MTDDTIKLFFGPGVKTTYEISIGNSNLAESFNTGITPQSKLHTEGGKIRISDLDANSRMNDILTPLTTNHHRSTIMSGSSLL